MDESDELIIPDTKGLEFLLRNAWLNVSKAPIANCLFLIDCFWLSKMYNYIHNYCIVRSRKEKKLR